MGLRSSHRPAKNQPPVCHVTKKREHLSTLALSPGRIRRPHILRRSLDCPHRRSTYICLSHCAVGDSAARRLGQEQGQVHGAMAVRLVRMRLVSFAFPPLSDSETSGNDCGGAPSAKSPHRYLAGATKTIIRLELNKDGPAVCVQQQHFLAADWRGASSPALGPHFHSSPLLAMIDSPAIKKRVIRVPRMPGLERPS
ncbi:hypothetical protein LX36DRAFT_439722 [Colletotrichum falcatum]|nr:hypothetical protein LX36DRAFT_439722 [Colletotrichum falcatum]